MPKIAVIIPAHNEEKYLGKTLESLRQQNFLDYETIIVCNGCADKTEEIAKKFINQNTKILSAKEANVSLARNLGAQQASSDILLFLDADTLLEPTSLQTISQNFTEKYFVAATKTKPDSSKLKYRLALFLKNLAYQTKLYPSCSGALICRKKDFHQVGGYSPEINVKEQYKLLTKLKELGEYKVIKTTTTTSMRRFEQWGLIKVVFFWLKQEFKEHFNLNSSKYEVVR